MASFIAIVFVFLSMWAPLSGRVSSYDRPPPRETLYFPSNFVDSTTPQQVHVSKVGIDKMRISWITHKRTSSKVEYGTRSKVYDSFVEGSASSYKYVAYKSGQIHEAVIGPLAPNTVYYYRCSGHASREFHLKTTPAQLPIKFVVAGDLGQTGWTKTTLEHISKSNYDMLLLPGDLSYADCWQPRWDSFGRMVEPLASQRPWMVTTGNHEVEKLPLVHNTPFTAYNARWRMPYKESGSPSNLFYSFNVASSVHVIMLGSYTSFATGSSQYNWLEQDLKRIDRKRTPWVFVLLHAPWYNSNKAHQGEKESVNMRFAMEKLLYEAKVDVVFTGHVHAYERFTRVYEGKANKCGPIHITIGDGGNREGLASTFLEKQTISMFREASFGHGELSVVNTTHAQWIWNRNQDDQPVSTDSLWLTSLAYDTNCIPHQSYTE
ncbi:hypothetical protein KSS87_019571 [Heliosperma pusillum]|nr:hypothetical protein KSS87_019571 [Heliosperma pusillum]